MTEDELTKEVRRMLPSPLGWVETRWQYGHWSVHYLPVSNSYWALDPITMQEKRFDSLMLAKAWVEEQYNGTNT